MKIDRNGAFHGEDGKYISKNGLVKIPLDFFDESALKRQPDAQLKKGIKTLQKRIDEHKEYLTNPHIKWQGWDFFDDVRKKREIEHWIQEIETFRENIKNREEELKRRRADRAE